LSNILFRNAELSRGGAGAALGGARRRGDSFDDDDDDPYDPTEFIVDEDD
jgi:hypothetical protein